MTVHPALRRPAATEYAPYYQRYIDCVPEGDLRETLRVQRGALARAFLSLLPHQVTRRPRAEAWNALEILGHLIDTERVFAYRATAFSRGDTAPLPSFDQDAWLPYGHYAERVLSSLVEEWSTVRAATLVLAEHLPLAGWDRAGVASDAHCSARAALWIIPGHVQYHLDRLSLTTAPGT